MNSVKSTYYLPPPKRERSNLQQVKDKYRSFIQANKEGVPKDLADLKDIRHREHALLFLKQYADVTKNTNKTKYCKSHHISHNSLNTGLELVGYKTRVKKTDSSTNKCVPVQSKKIKTKRAPTKPKATISDQNEVKAGTGYDEEKINEILSSSMANLKTSS